MPAPFWKTVFSRTPLKRNPVGVCETQERHWFSITSPNDLATVWSTLSVWADTMRQDWWVSRHTAVRWVVGALSGWIGGLWTGGKHNRGLVNNRMGRLRAPSAPHSRAPSGLIRKADEWCAWGEEGVWEESGASPPPSDSLPPRHCSS